MLFVQTEMTKKFSISNFQFSIKRGFTLISKAFKGSALISKACQGFTLIELLVVISIIGILASLALVSYSGAQKQTRDTQRRSDLAQYRNALETYATSNSGVYPASLTTIDGLCTALSTNFIASCPPDPLTGTYDYGFYSSVDGTAYVIYSGLETGAATDYWEICSIGESGKVSGLPGDSICDL